MQILKIEFLKFKIRNCEQRLNLSRLWHVVQWSCLWHCALECGYQYFGTVPWNVTTNILALCFGMWLPTFWHCALECGYQHLGTVP